MYSLAKADSLDNHKICALILKGTIHYGLRYARDGELMLHGFVDSNFTGDARNKNSIWFSRKQASVASSSAEA
jgi:hypothetical protein